MKPIKIILLSLLFGISHICNAELLTKTNVGASLSYSNTGTYEWQFDYTKNRLQSTNKGISNSTSTTTITFSINDNAAFSFDYQVSSENGFDKLTITLDNTTIVDHISGNVSNTYKSTLSKGAHKLTLTYSKDSSQDDNDDRAYISNIKCVTNSGKTGDLSWIVENGVLSLSGNGATDSYYDDYLSPWYCFRDEIKKINLSNQTSSIGNHCFSGLNNVTSITIPASVMNIGYGAFGYCTALSNVIIEDSDNSLSIAGGYDGCPEGDDYCMVYVFSGTNIKTLYVGREFTNNNYLDIPYIQSITFGPNVTDVSIFRQISSSNITVTIDSNNKNLSIKDNMIFNANKTTLLKILPQKNGAVVLPNTITAISPYAAYNCSSITSITLPDMCDIGAYAFLDCQKLKTLNFTETSGTSADNTTHIGECAFSYYDNYNDGYFPLSGITFNYPTLHSYLIGAADPSYGTISIANTPLNSFRSITIPTDINIIKSSKFKNQNHITSVTLHNNISQIRSSAFYGCTGLTKVIINNIESWFNIGFTSSDSNPLNYAHRLYLNNNEIKEINVPSTVTKIKDYAFSGYSGLTSLTIPNSMTSIGSYAFEGCSGLTSLTIPNSVTSIGNSAFSECSGLTSLTIPNSMTSIERYVFYKCSNLKTIELGTEIKSIGDYAFYGTNPTTLICRAITPPTIGSNNTFGSKKNIYVPCNSMDEYKTAWSSLNIGTYQYLPLLDVMFLERTNKALYQKGLLEKNKNNITSIAFYGGIDSDITESIIKNGMNPNCLYYVPQSSTLSGDNIIKLDAQTTEKVTLTDGYPYDCPIPFHAKTVEYKHTPSVWANGKSGWETLTLPFEATEFEASKSGYIAPILLGSSGDFWLRKYVNSNNSNVFFSSLMEPVMESNTPYIIAFPGETMGNGHLQGQTITFRGVDVDIEVTEVPRQQKNQYTFVGNYDTVIDGVTGYELNKMGNAFVQSAEVGKEPFHAYFTTKDTSNNVKSLGISFGQYNDETGIFEVEDDGADTNIRQGSYDLSGRKTEAKSKGIYIVNGKKVVKL